LLTLCFARPCRERQQPLGLATTNVKYETNGNRRRKAETE
jgi:hypothetical protein